ncbi:MAG: alkaline phosphatase [Phycisphaerae bacterium]
MNKTNHACLAMVLFAAATFALAPTPVAAAPPKNVILLIGDGMGFEEVRAAGMYENGVGGTLSFEALPRQAEVTTYSASAAITDSAAAGTAIATGVKVNNGVISMAFPGDAGELWTLLEDAASLGRLTGLVTTTYITHATPATFGAHEPSRNNLSQIASDYLNQTRPTVLFGGGANGITTGAAAAAGYTVVTSRTAMQALDTNTVTRVSGQFGTTHLPYEWDYFTGAVNGYDTLPHLSEMAATALDILDNNPNGFFLMIEGGRIDHAGHSNNIQRNVFETIEFEHAVNVALNWATGRANTLILVTADHETGGLAVLQNNGQGNFPTVSWSSNYHTSVNVPVYAWGHNASMATGILDNIDFFDLVTVSDTPNLGDMNCDGLVDPGDVGPFVQALMNPPGYNAAHALCDIALADLNGDGAADGGDIQPFLTVLIP